jgi:DNA alkylation damage repair protein AlkB
MVDEGEAKLRENEKLLRRCSSISRAQKLVPPLIVDPSKSSSQLELLGSPEGKPVYRLRSLKPNVYLIPSFFPETKLLDLTHEILNRLIDNPPHANNFNDDSNPHSMWKELLHGKSETPRLKKLRWSCVGYHYNWGERTYDPDLKSDFPASFRELYVSVLDLVNYVVSEENKLSGDAQSAIINLYHSHRVSDRLGGHRDDVEVTDRTPLVSLSIGRPGFFLIENEAIVLHSGDVLVMADEARQSLHGVPGIVGGDRKKDSTGDQQTEREAITRFLSDTRISLSIRQVY